uniref:Uncharacterized conserved protein n=1 Tax=uncultured alpha proteobacterium HF0130_06E21 TaxID=710808 RepID=E0XT26_9PROT|nr:uncharacterized conserved protein [uncultured alpha proteobacterium HF0130_06E21]
MDHRIAAIKFCDREDRHATTCASHPFPIGFARDREFARDTQNKEHETTYPDAPRGRRVGRERPRRRGQAPDRCRPQRKPATGAMAGPTNDGTRSRARLRRTTRVRNLGAHARCPHIAPDFRYHRRTLPGRARNASLPYRDATKHSCNRDRRGTQSGHGDAGANARRLRRRRDARHDARFSDRRTSGFRDQHRRLGTGLNRRNAAHALRAARRGLTANKEPDYAFKAKQMTPVNTPARNRQNAITVELSAVIVAVGPDGPQVLVLQPDRSRPAALPSGPLESQHRTLDGGLRTSVEEQTGFELGYVEQLYSFGDANRHASARAKLGRALSIGYLALVHEDKLRRTDACEWRSWYDFFPWEDWRDGTPGILASVRDGIAGWIAEAPRDQRKSREERAQVTFCVPDGHWNEELALERYELLYEIGLVPEAHRDGADCWAPREAAIMDAQSLQADHRRILATAISRLRGKIKYRPVVFELMPSSFTFLELQRAVEALAGVELHKANFRRLVEHQGLVEDTGAKSAKTGGRPASLFRFRREVVLERPASGVGLPPVRRRPD